jgi:hypothetical protein
MYKQWIIASLLLALVGCGDEEPPWVGSYAATGTWDISGPLAGGRTVGDAVADLLVEQIVSLAGVPSLLEDQAYDLVAKAIRVKVKAVVDGNVPTELAPGGTVNDVLATSLAAVRVESEIELEKGLLPGSMKGSEIVNVVEYQHEGVAYRLAAQDLAGAGATIDAEWSGDESDDNTLEVDPHGVSIHYGELMRRVAGAVVDAAGLTSLKDQVQTAVSCDQIVAQIVGGGQGLDISVSDWSYTVSADDLKSACAAVSNLAEDRVLGLFALDTLLEVGGPVTWQGSPASELKSGAGFGGTVNVAPRAIAPRVTVVFTAERQ